MLYKYVNKSGFGLHTADGETLVFAMTHFFGFCYQEFTYPK